MTAVDPKRTVDDPPRTITYPDWNELMKSETLNDWLQLVGLFGIMASLFFVGMQVRQTQAIGEGESATNFIAITVAAREMLASHADVWVKGCVGEEMSVADEAVFAQLYRTYSQTSYFAWLAARNGILEVDPRSLTNAFAANIHRYPGFASMGADWRNWQEEGFKDSIENVREYGAAVSLRLAELKTVDPDPNYDVKWCGM
jgi:hypothetical protein